MTTPVKAIASWVMGEDAYNVWFIPEFCADTVAYGTRPDLTLTGQQLEALTKLNYSADKSRFVAHSTPDYATKVA